MSDEPSMKRTAVPTSVKMMAVGRGVARAEAQAASKKVPMAGNSGGGSKPYGGGMVRGTGGQTSGKKWKGVT